MKALFRPPGKPTEDRSCGVGFQYMQSSVRQKKPIVTQIVKATEFYLAEGYHQDYLLEHRGRYTCHFLRD